MRTASAYTLSASGRTSDRGGTVAAQRFSQILSPDAPPAFEKSRLVAREVCACVWVLLPPPQLPCRSSRRHAGPSASDTARRGTGAPSGGTHVSDTACRATRLEP